MDERAPLRRSALVGLCGVALVTLGLAAVVGAPAPSAPRALVLAHLADSEDHLRALVASLLLVPGFALLLWFAAGLRRVLTALATTDRLPSLVLPGMAVFAAAALGGQALAAAPAVTAAVTNPEVVDAPTYRLLTVAGLAFALAGLGGAAVLVAASSRVAGEARAVPLTAEVGGYLVAVTCALGYFGYGVAVPLLLLWLAGACVAVWRYAGPPGPDEEDGATERDRGPS